MKYTLSPEQIAQKREYMRKYNRDRRADLRAGISRIKDPSRVARGLKGAASRWGGQEPSVVRIGDLDDAKRRKIFDLIADLRRQQAEAA